MTGRVVAGVLALTTLFACGCGDKASSPASVGRTKFTIATEPFKPQASFTFSYIPVTISFTDGAIKFKIAKKWVTKYGTFEWGNEAAVAKIEIERPGAVVFQWGNQGYWLDIAQSRLETIRRKPDFEIEADVVEVWSSTFYKPDTGAVVDQMASHEVPQTITIQQGDRGWRITKVHFRR